MLENIPGEMRSLAQWVAAGPSKLPINPRTGQAASVTDPATWGTFEEAVRAGLKHVGFVLAPWDPYSIIDLDAPRDENDYKRHESILQAFNSYTERSQSGNGYHIIVRGAVPAGARRDKVEVYSSQRYMICTGNVVNPLPITERQALLDQLFAEMQPVASTELVDRAAVMEDMELVEMAMAASNGEKFNSLCRGEMSEYPSQSEADFALLSIIAFYTQDNEQVRRIFRMTALGKRDKANRDNKYLNRALEKIRAQQPEPVNFDQLIANAAALTKVSEVIEPAIDHGNLNTAPATPLQTLTTGAKLNAHTTPPPGLIGELAAYFYQAAIRPVPEIAMAAAVAIVAGVVARSYNISGSGLNQYLILLAKTGSGKEGALSGIENLISAIRPQVPMASQFLGPATFASGQALVKVLNDRPCFVSVLGEFGLTLQQLSDHRANSAQLMLRKVLLDLYAKSGWNRTLQSSVYSDIEKNTKIIQAPNVTILGESTPETFFDGLDASHIAEGLIPRFTVIEYNGDRPARNRNANVPPSPELAQRFADLIAIAMTTTNNHTCCPVQLDADALKILDDFDTEADRIMNSSKHDVEMQLWNRAHLKALKLAALVAVGINPHSPVVTGDAARWAIAFTRQDVEGVAKRFKDGDVGQGDSKQMHDMKRVVEHYFKTKPKEVDAKLHAARLISYRHISQRCANIAAFRNDRMGSTHATKKMIQMMIDSGMLIEVPATTLQKNHQFNGIAYGVGNAWS